MGQAHYQKFVVKKKNSVIKEEFKQAKKKAKKERAEAINRRFEEKRQLRAATRNVAAQPPSTGKPAAVTPAPGAQKTGRDRLPQKTFAKDQPMMAPTVPASRPDKKSVEDSTEMPLNKFMAHCGVCSRREAVDLIKEGKVKVNKVVVMEPAHRVSQKDEVVFNGKTLFVSKNLVYILLNKPKDYITTTDDPQGRKTVLQLTKMATTERIYPVGRLDRNTSGVLLLTNDGELTQKLSHPSYNITKVYEARLDKALSKGDLDKIAAGITLEDGPIKADSVAYADPKDKSVIGIEIHSGRNRIVRRIFEHLGYDVKALDRVLYANLTKKNVERGKWRFLSEKEIRLLKFMNGAKKKMPAPEKPITPQKNERRR